MTHITVAVRDIFNGEELSISYVDGTLPHAERQSMLKGWGFTCSCQQCKLPPEEIEKSDERLRRIKELISQMDAADEAVTVDTSRELIGLYQAERLDTYLGHAYTRAALNCALWGDACAAEYAGEAIGALEREHGRNSGDIEGMRRLQSNMTAHWAWDLKKKAGKPGRKIGGKSAAKPAAKPEGEAVNGDE
jgi:hypothetical protein